MDFQNQAAPSDAAATAPHGGAIDSITALCCRKSQLVAKRVRPGGEMSDYDDTYLYAAHVLPVNGLDDLERELRRISPNPRVCVIRGEPTDPTNMVGIRRKKYDDDETGDKATFREVKRWWVAFDFDSLPLPAGTDVTDLKKCAMFALEVLPEEFWAAGCIVQATASHGIKTGLRLRIWVWLSRPLGEAELKRWFADNKKVDHSVFRTVQPIYTAAPIFENGALDPLPTRILRLPGCVVDVPDDLSAPETESDTEDRADTRARHSTEEGPREPISPAGADRIIAWALEQLAHVEDGEKRNALYRVAFTLGGLMAHKGWSEADIVGRLLATLPRAKDWGVARKTAVDGVRDGAKRPFPVVDCAAPEFDPVPPESDDSPEPAAAPDVVLNPSAPVDTARKFIGQGYTADGKRTLHHQGGVFFAWTGSHYGEHAAEEVRARLYGFMDKAKRADKDGKLVPFNPKRNPVGDALEALRGVAQIPGAVRAPAWLGSGDNRPPADELLACKNGLLHLPTRALLAHSPQFFAMNALDYAFDASAPAPGEWLKFLQSVWIDDKQMVDTLQELFGLLLTPNTAHQKLFLMIGPKRSGKGTIARVLTHLLGRANVASPTLADMARNFGLAQLIGKPLAIIGDARLGKSTDPASVAERLLSISGEDGQSIDRKFLTPWVGTLATRFLIVTNELPRLTDASGALAGRFIILPMTRSFYGREDHDLLNRLLPELPGILNWALGGLDRLNTRGYFVQPRAARESIEALEDLASPVGAFIRQRCVTGAGHFVEKSNLYSAWVAWCAGQNRHPGTDNVFARDLKAVLAEVTAGQHTTVDGKRVRVYRGVALAGDAPAALF